MEMSLGKKIAMLRKQANMTQEQLGEFMGVSAQAVSKWENDQSYPDIMMLPTLAEKFHVTTDQLLSNKAVQETVVVPKAQRKNIDDIVLKIHANSSDGDKIRVNLPMPIVIAGFGFEMVRKKMGNNGINIDVDSIVKMVENGVMGKIMELESADGDIMIITLE